ELELGAEADRGALDAHALDHAAVRRTRIADDDFIVDDGDRDVLARHRAIGQHEVALRTGADRQRTIAEPDHRAAIRALDDEEYAAAVLSRMRRRVVEQRGHGGSLSRHPGAPSVPSVAARTNDSFRGASRHADITASSRRIRGYFFFADFAGAF